MYSTIYTFSSKVELQKSELLASYSVVLHACVECVEMLDYEDATRGDVRHVNGTHTCRPKQNRTHNSNAQLHCSFSEKHSLTAQHRDSFFSRYLTRENRRGEYGKKST